MTITQVRKEPDPYDPCLLSQGARAGDMLYVSGQAGYDDDGRIVEGGRVAQGMQAFPNFDRTLRAESSSLRKVAKVTSFVTDRSHCEKVVDLRHRFSTKPDPADSIVEIKALYTPEVMIEIEAVAVIDERGN